MSKVLVDRELLRDSSAELSDWRMSFPDADSGMTDRLVGEIDAILAQPAEAEGAEVVGYASAGAIEILREIPQASGMKVRGCSKDRFVVPLVRQSDHLAALSAVTAERDRLREEMAELWKRIDKFQSQSHGITALAEIERLRAEVEALRPDAERYQWLRGRLPGSAYRIAGVIYSEGGEGVDAAIEAAMAAKE